LRLADPNDGSAGARENGRNYCFKILVEDFSRSPVLLLNERCQPAGSQSKPRAAVVVLPRNQRR